MPYAGLLLSFAAITILLFLIAILIRRKQHRDFPFFFTYAVFSILAAIARHIASSHPVEYFIVYWSAEDF